MSKCIKCLFCRGGHHAIDWRCIRRHHGSLRLLALCISKFSLCTKLSTIEFTLLWTRVNFECLMAHLFKAVNRARFLGGFTDCSGGGLFVLGSFEELTHVLLFVSAGCMYKNNLYQHGQSWNDGCDYKCTCKDGVSGRYECTTRSSCIFTCFLQLKQKPRKQFYISHIYAFT